MYLTDLTINVKGDEFTFAVEVTEDGTFTTDYQGDVVNDERLDSLRRSLQDVVLASRAEVPFVTATGRAGIIRGYHAGQRALLVTWSNGEKGTLNTHAQVYRELSDEQVAEVKAAAQQFGDAQARVETARDALGDGERASTLLSGALGEDITLPEHRRQPEVTA